MSILYFSELTFVILRSAAHKRKIRSLGQSHSESHRIECELG
jgi:hypothetical protein